MKTLAILALALLLNSCSRTDRSPVFRTVVSEADVIVLADVVTTHSQEHLIARDVLQGTLGPEFHFAVGGEIKPALNRPLAQGASVDRIDGLLLLYKLRLGTMDCFAFYSVSDGKILALTGADADLVTFVRRMKDH